MKKALIFFILVSLIFSGCTKQTSVLVSSNEDYIMIYNPFTYKFVSYNKKTLLPETKKVNENEKNILQFSFTTKSKYYTSGDCYKRNFEIIKLNNGLIESVYKLENKDTEAIFPLASDEKNVFFFKADYSKKGLPISKIVKFDSNTLKEFPNTNGLISNGAILNNLLYYTVFDESQKTYSLYSLDYSNFTNTPKLIETNLKASELFVLNNKLYLSNNDAIYCKNDVFQKSSMNFYDVESNTLIQINPNPNNDNQLTMKIIKADTKKEIKTINNIIGFIIEKGELTAYCYKGIEKIQLTLQ